jgi:D-sedoheptulose 7-phosphate isomerase
MKYWRKKEMKKNVEFQLNNLIERYPSLYDCRKYINSAFEIIIESYKNGGKLLIAGNGGSAADAEHITGELMKGFYNPRRIDDEYARRLRQVDETLGIVLAENLQGALPTIALHNHPALLTAYMNDCEPLLCFAQQVNGYGCASDVFVGISTSGNSKNILYAAVVAKAKGMKIVGLTGQKGNKLEKYSDVCIMVPEVETYKIQELHLPVYHALCLMIEAEFFG